MGAGGWGLGVGGWRLGVEGWGLGGWDLGLGVYLRYPPHQTAYATYHTTPPKLHPAKRRLHTCNPSPQSPTRSGPAVIGCFWPFLLSPEQLGPCDFEGLDQLLLPMLRIENLEVRPGILQDTLQCTQSMLRCLVVAQKVEQSAHVLGGLLRLPVCLVRAEDSRSVLVISRACCVL